jgi:hypothetical protein
MAGEGAPSFVRVAPAPNRALLPSADLPSTGIQIQLARLQQMTAHKRGAPIQFIEQHTGRNAIPGKEIVVNADQHPRIDGFRQFNRLSGPQIADDPLMLTKVVLGR